MSTLAWAVVFIGLVYYERLYGHSQSKDARNVLGFLTVVSLIFLVVLTLAGKSG